MSTDLRRLFGRYQDDLERDAARMERRNPFAPEATEIDHMVIEAIRQVMQLGLGFKGPKGGSPGTRALLRVLDRSLPILLEDLAKVPDQEIVQSFSEITQRMDDLYRRMVEAAGDGRPAAAQPDQPAPG